MSRIITFLMVLIIVSLQSVVSVIVLSDGRGYSREVLPEWSITRRWYLTDSAHAINVSRQIGATGVLLLIYLEDLEAGELLSIRNYIKTYRAAGFRVYITISARMLVEPSDIQELLKLNIVGIGINLYGTFNVTEAQNSLIALYRSCLAARKSLSYYHGDGLSNVDAFALHNAGLIIRAWGDRNWKPGYAAWSLNPVWGELPIFNTGERYTYGAYIEAWYANLPRLPEAIVWWLSNCFHNPTQEQIEAMRKVSIKFIQG